MMTTPQEHLRQLLKDMLVLEGATPDGALDSYKQVQVDAQRIPQFLHTAAC